MKDMKPFQIILIAVFGVVALIGLFVFATYSGFSGKATVGTVVIWGTLPQSAVNDAISAVKNSNKSYANVSYVEQPADGFDAALANALASGTGPDLVILNQEELLSEEPKISLIPFSSIPLATFNKTYVAEDQLYLTTTGTYGIPLVVDPLVLYYNRTILSSAGVAVPPTTWEAVTGLVPTLTKQDANQTITQATVPFGSYGNVVNARAILSALFLQAGSAITEDTQQGERSILSQQTTTDTGTGTTAAEAAANFYTQFANPAKTIYSWNPSLPSSRQAFIGGNLAFYPGFASEQPAFAAANPNLDFDMAPLPQAATGARATYGLAYAFAIPKIAANKTGAYDTALALTASGILPNLAKELGMAPATRSLLTNDPANPFTDVYYPEALSAKGWLSPAPDTVDQVFAAMISNITTGRYETIQALSAADQSLDAAF